jgi:hypothetical protein
MSVLDHEVNGIAIYGLVRRVFMRPFMFS